MKTKQFSCKQVLCILLITVTVHFMVTILPINNLNTIITLLSSLHLIISLLLPVIICITARYKQVINNILQLVRTLILIN
jgi:hypothetical protein